MKNQINESFVALLRKHIPDRQIVPLLTDMLSLGKESIYRRLRSDIPFTFEDVVRISQWLGISLDDMMDKYKPEGDSKWATLNMDVFHSASDYMQQWSRKHKMMLNLFSDIQVSEKSMMRCATNCIPHSLLPFFETLYRFRHYKWMYMTLGLMPNSGFSKMHLPPHAIDMDKELVIKSQHIPRTLYVMNRNAFEVTINDIRYFWRRNLVSDDELRILKNELLELVTLMESMATKGINQSGSEIALYLCDVDIASSYIHVESDNFEFCAHWVYFIDNMIFQNSKMCRKQKDWIESLKKYSLFITQSNEEQRFDFFNRQRQLIEDLLVKD